MHIRLLSTAMLVMVLTGCGAPTASVPTIAAPTVARTSTTAPTARLSTPSPSVPTPATDAIVTQVDTLFDNLAKMVQFSGSVLIARNGTVLVSKGYGLADRDKNIPNTPQTKFRISSMTKPFTALAILQLQQQGKLTVQDQICQYLSDCPPAWKDITIHHLLTHTSGIPDADLYFDLPATATTPTQSIAAIKDQPLDFKPGAKWGYSNGGYLALTGIIEKVSGGSYGAFLQEHIFTPLDMRATGVDDGAQTIAIGYVGVATSPGPKDITNAGGAISLYSTVEDIYRLDQALYTEQLVSKAMLDTSFTSYVSAPPDSIIGTSDYGYGWFLTNRFNHRTIGHAGLGPGISANIDRYPDEKVTIIYLSNQQYVASNVVSTALAKIVFGVK